MHPLFTDLHNKEVPLSSSAIEAIAIIKQQIKDAILYIVNPSEELTVTTDASDVAIRAILSQNGRPVAFMSKRLFLLSIKLVSSRTGRFGSG